MPATTTTAATPTTTERDRDCAVFAREALFPQQLHRVDASQYPALAALDRWRQLLRQSPAYSTHPSALFPRGVVLVRDLQHDSDGSLKWNGRPDIKLDDASFPVVPNLLTVRCTSDCARYAPYYSQHPRQPPPMALLIPPEKTAATAVADYSANETKSTTLLLCTNRLLQKDYREPLDSVGVAKELPRRSYHAIEEAVAHQVAKLVAVASMDQHNSNNNNSNPDTPSTTLSSSSSNNSNSNDELIRAQARIELQAARMAECYYSRHDNNASSPQHAQQQQPAVQYRRGSGLPRGFSLFPTRQQQYWQRRCWIETATQHLQWNATTDVGTSTAKVRQMVQQALLEQEQQQQQCDK